MKAHIPTGSFSIPAPRPFRVEYPYGLPGDGLRKWAQPYNATCVVYHRDVDPRMLGHVRAGNGYRYDSDDPRHVDLVESMRENGFVGGDGGRMIIHVTHDDAWIAEGNHRLRAALEAGLSQVDLEIRYLCNADEVRMLIEFDPSDPAIAVVSD